MWFIFSLVTYSSWIKNTINFDKWMYRRGKKMTALVMTSLKQQWYKANSYNLFQLINSVLAKSHQHWDKGKFYYHRLMENMYNLWYLCEVVIYNQELLLKSRMHIILSLSKNNVYNFVNIYKNFFFKKKLWSLQSDRVIIKIYATTFSANMFY